MTAESHRVVFYATIDHDYEGLCSHDSPIGARGHLDVAAACNSLSSGMKSSDEEDISAEPPQHASFLEDLLGQDQDDVDLTPSIRKLSFNRKRAPQHPPHFMRDQRERLRCLEINDIIQSISARVPSVPSSHKETRIVKLERAISYICHLEGQIKELCSKHNMEIRLKHLFLTPKMKEPFELSRFKNQHCADIFYKNCGSAMSELEQSMLDQEVPDLAPLLTSDMDLTDALSLYDNDDDSSYMPDLISSLTPDANLIDTYNNDRDEDFPNLSDLELPDLIPTLGSGVELENYTDQEKENSHWSTEILGFSDCNDSTNWTAIPPLAVSMTDEELSKELVKITDNLDRAFNEDVLRRDAPFSNIEHGIFWPASETLEMNAHPRQRTVLSDTTNLLNTQTQQLNLQSANEKFSTIHEDKFDQVTGTKKAVSAARHTGMRKKLKKTRTKMGRKPYRKRGKTLPPGTFTYPSDRENII